MIEQARAIAERVAASEGLEVVDVEWHGSGRRGVLRIFIDKPSGVSLADCETVSKQVSTILDVEDVVPGGAYALEVSSPGLDRKLVKPGDYERFRGKKATIRLRTPLAGRGQFTGRLAGLSNAEEALLETAEGETLRFGLQDIRTARLVVEI
ncbi:MAG: ribosome maturation factor RimP [Bryobacterales bacterium]|nr:ribosome maturation factor RimP [Bryobacterales bacterium]